MVNVWDFFQLWPSMIEFWQQFLRANLLHLLSIQSIHVRDVFYLFHMPKYLWFSRTLICCIAIFFSIAFKIKIFRCINRRDLCRVSFRQYLQWTYLSCWKETDFAGSFEIAECSFHQQYISSRLLSIEIVSTIKYTRNWTRISYEITAQLGIPHPYSHSHFLETMILNIRQQQEQQKKNELHWNLSMVALCLTRWHYDAVKFIYDMQLENVNARHP